MRTKMQRAARGLRWLILAANVAFFLFLSKFISLHAICPIGGFELFFNGLFSTGFSIAGLFSGMVITFLFTSLLSIVFRRAYCGYLCPLGAVQELFERIGKAVLPRRLRELRLPAKVDRALRYLKYAALASFVVGAAVWGGHWMIAGDPFIVFMGLASGDIASLVARQPYAFAFFALILVFAFFFGRGFCKYLCPAGAWYGLLSKISPNRIVRNESACIGCGLCSKACPANIDVAKLQKVTTAECLGCRECVNACPQQGALSAPIAAIPVPAVLAPVAAAAVFSVGLSVAAATLPAAGERQQGEGGQLHSHDGSGQRQGGGAQFHRGGQNGGQQQPGKVGFGGCSTCTGCGFCGLGSTQPKV